MPQDPPPIRKPDIAARERAWEIYRGGDITVRRVAQLMGKPYRTVRRWINQCKKRDGIRPEPRFTGRIRQLQSHAA